MNPVTQEIGHLVDRLGELLMPYGCVGLRTSYFVTDQGVSRRSLICERHGASPRYAVLSMRPTQREKGVKSLVSTIGVTEELANEVLDLAHELSEFNDVGAWPFVTDERPAVLVSATGVNDVPYAQLPGFGPAFLCVQINLPAIDRIVISQHVGERKGGRSQKGWMHFFDAGENQICAVSINSLATMIREWYGEVEDKRAEADAHLGRWAHQCGVDLHAFIEAAMHLMSFDAYLRVTEIDLRDP